MWGTVPAGPSGAVAMKAADVAVALTKRWPEDRHLHIPEATFDPWRQGTKIDVAVLACWQSLKWQIDAVEIKVSLSDFKKEIERYYWTVDAEWSAFNGIPNRYEDRRHAVSDRLGRPLPDGSICWDTAIAAEHWPIVRHSEPCTHKSQPWRDVAHRFWIACPTKLASKIEPLLPDGEGWGVLAVDGRGCTVVVKPTVNTEPRSLEWRETVGLLRCAVDASQRVRGRAYDKGVAAGYERAVIDFQALDPDLPGLRFDEQHPDGSRWWSGRPGQGLA